MRIAFFDSGIGGLTVLKKAVTTMPNEEYLYYADTLNVPYGVKPKDEVRSYIFAAAEFLAKQNIQALVIACNTATSVAVSDLRKRFSFPIIGMEPAIKPAIVNNTGRKILVFATSLTLKESKLETLIANLDKDHKVERRELDGLVSFAENFEFDTPLVRQYLQEKLGNIQWEHYETIVLGCTHFIFYRNVLQALVGNKIRLVDGNEGTVKHLVRTVRPYLSTEPTPHTRIVFYASGTKDDPARVRQLMKLLR
ncbi:MAG TPA: glutamate racemase [Kiritimatiellia bacterium]|nr:glutamate racemase [Kiritimatiellia bacterium]HPS08731.1 glutamate racemase [Kiritimatiellia bacterium]